VENYGACIGALSAIPIPTLSIPTLPSYPITTAVLRIQIRTDPVQPQSDKLDPDPDPHNLQTTCQNVWNMSTFQHFFKVLSLYLEA
jgi:hypothetical protein